MNTDCSQKRIIEFIKAVLGVSFKKWSARPVTRDSDRISTFKILFRIEFTNFVDNSWIIININDISFSRLTKPNYSWSSRDEISLINYILFAESRLLIWVITSGGEWFASHFEGTYNSVAYVEFVDKLVKWIRIDLHYSIEKIILLDNWSIHNVKKWKWYLNKLGCLTVYLPLYSSKYAPVELFFNTLKNKLENGQEIQ